MWDTQMLSAKRYSYYDGVDLRWIWSSRATIYVDTQVSLWLEPYSRCSEQLLCVGYYSLQKAWMDATVWNPWLNERRASGSLPNGKRLVLCVDDCSSHVTAPDMFASLTELKTIFQKFSRNATDKIQPGDFFVIQKIRKVWRRWWDCYKMNCVRERFSEKDENGNKGGKLQNSEISFTSQTSRRFSAQSQKRA